MKHIFSHGGILSKERRPLCSLGTYVVMNQYQQSSFGEQLNCQLPLHTLYLHVHNTVRRRGKWRGKSAVYKWKRFLFCFLLFDTPFSAAYIRKRFNFESGLDSEKYGIYHVGQTHCGRFLQ